MFDPLQIEELLQVSTLTLATTGPEGVPHAAPLYFVATGRLTDTAQPLRLYFFSDPNSRHGQHLAQRPQAAAALYPESDSWLTIRGLQMHGEVRPVEPGPEWEQAWAAYESKFPFVRDLQSVVARNTLYAFFPSWVRRVDNRQGFGFKEEYEII